MLISRKAALVVAIAASSAVALAACGSSSGSSKTSGKAPAAGSSNPLAIGAANLDAKSGSNGTHGTNPVTGGTLKLLGGGDVDYLDTAGGYYTVTYTLMRGYTRQLVSYPNSVDPKVANTVVADMATSVPKPTNNNKTYTFTIKNGVQWDTTPPRQVTGADEIRGIKRLCNPYSASGGVGYYEATIVGMQTFCDGFSKVKTDAASIKAYMDSNQISGLTANGDQVTFNLVQPAGDFLNILALPFASPVPVEYEQYVPNSADVQQHIISDGPYTITKYVPQQSISMVRNPAWKASTDALRHAYVNAVQVTEGSDAAPVQQALQTGDADMEWDTTVPAASLATLKASNDPHLQIQNTGSTLYAVFNEASTTEGGALGKTAVRQALQYCVAKSDIVQIEGGSVIAAPLDQILTPPILGYKQIDPYNNLNGNEDAAKGKSMLAAAGYPNGLKLTFLYRNKAKAPNVAQALQQDMAKCGVTLTLKQAATADFYAKILQQPTASSQWDMAVPGWNPDWQGNAARSFFVPLLDPRTYGPGTTNYGAYGVAPNTVPGLTDQIDSALSTTDQNQVADKWAALDAATMKNAPWIPLVTVNNAGYYGKNVSNWVFFNFANNGDITNVWLTNG
ncbi:MAG TPA: ABC transporter substrate-binding protein [Mycobacteriales bacterium]